MSTHDLNDLRRRAEARQKTGPLEIDGTKGLLELAEELDLQKAEQFVGIETCARVLLVDDHAMMRQGLRAILETYADVQVVGDACDGSEALAAVDRLRPHVILMDINMPKKNGIEATADIKARYPDVQIIGLSVNAGHENQVAMLKAGASMLLTKEAAVEQLYSAIQEVVNNRRNLDKALELRGDQP
jgi:DNA-binding NarL/FixJ family response regulator